MIRLSAALLLMPLTGGCVAALIPATAAVGVAKAHAQERRDKQPERVAPKPVKKARLQLIEGMTALPAPDGKPVAPASAANDSEVPDGMRYLYGSGEASALSVQAYQALTAYLDMKRYTRREQLRQVVMSDGSTLSAPHFEPCGDKPLAAVFDIDETALLNLGFEADVATRGNGYDDPRWQRWEATGADKVAAVPGAVAATTAMRAHGITVIFNSNRAAANAAATEVTLDHAGLGPAKHGSTLWLKGDDGSGSNKDGRRWAIASGYCVIALVGDQLGDFSDLFNAADLTPAARRAAAELPAVAALWGNGWFVLPNPVYGSGLKGGFDDVFPADKRWSDPAEGVK